MILLGNISYCLPIEIGLEIWNTNVHIKIFDFSDGISYETGLSVMSLSSWSSRSNDAFFVGRGSSFSCPGNSPCTLSFQTSSNQLRNPYLVRGDAYDRNTDTYTCQSSGPHLFTFSIGTQAQQPVSVKKSKHKT